MGKLVRRMFFALLAPVALQATDAWAQQTPQTGGIAGTVQDATTQRPLAGVNVLVEGTQIGTFTNEQGRFLIPGVPAGRHTVRIETLGYGAERITVDVEAGRTTSANVRLQTSAVKLSEIVVTGVAGATEKQKLAFTVDKLTPAELPVPAVNAGSIIQGKVAGAQVVSPSGRPGAAPSILLRGPKSINSTGRSQEPLYIVDGVILGADIADIPATDIESIEIVKGAAAASLYGSRAAYGVVQITTKRGSFAGADQTRYTFRSEYGSSDLERTIGIAQNHRFYMNPSQTKFLTTTPACSLTALQARTCTGREFDWLEGGNVDNGGGPGSGRPQPTTTGSPWTTYQDQPWPQTFNHIDRFFDPGSFTLNYLGVEGRSGGTRYHVSLNYLDEGGILLNQTGRNLTTARVNLDQGLMDNLNMSASVFYSRGNEGALGEGTTGVEAGSASAFYTLTRMPAGVDLLARDDAGELIIRPDQTGENSNPIYQLLNRDRQADRERFIGGATLRYSPWSFMDLDGNVSYDRSSYDQSDYYPKGYQTARPSQYRLGYVDKYTDKTQAMNASVTASLRHSFSEQIHNRTQLRWLMERQEFAYNRGFGFDLAAADVPTLFNTKLVRTPRSAEENIRSEGFFAITNFDIMDRYIIDALVRRDGSSLFGADERWQTYYRGAAAWRLSQESFWDSFRETVNELKLRYSYGTAGGRPAFAAQYETYTVGDAGVLTAVSLGNRKLKPEFAVEQEFGVDASILNRVTASLVYAASEVKDQILRVPLAGYTGFEEQWLNAGTLESKTWEASLDVPWVRSDQLNFSTRFLWDRTRQQITEMSVAPFQYGIPTNQGLEKVFYARPGEAIGTFYGNRFATQCTELPETVQSLCATQFQVNDDGYLVWVGANRTYLEGKSANLWGTRGPEVRGSQLYWGTPFIAQEADGETFVPLGRTTPDFSFTVANTLNFGNLTVYGLVDAVRGFDIYNLPRQWAYFENYHSDQDQLGKPDELKKPEGYYTSTGLYQRLSPPNSHFVEDGSFVKLREVSVRYSFGEDVLNRIGFLRGVDGIALSLIGRNLKTWTKYSGYDPEVGFAGGNTGSAALARFDGFQYPNFRTFTGAIEITF